jgi:histidinol-phosphatase (PHP family)
MLVDYHVHTALCGHAVGEMQSYVKVAAQKGLEELGFNDHAPMLHLRDPGLTMASHELPIYVEQVKALQSEHRRPQIKLGIEADFVPGHEGKLRQLLSQYEFDYICGSVHFIDDWGFDDSRFMAQYHNHHVDEAYVKFFDLVRKSAQSGLFDILGHIDLIKKFNYRPTKKIDGLLGETVQTIADAGVCVEVNTSGLRRPCGEIYPSEQILKLCQRHGVPVTLGSDAHRPQDVGRDFDVAVEVLRRVGYNKVATFTERERRMVGLH